MNDYVTCACCLGDPDEVCDACGKHACWAGLFMCEDSATAGVIRREDFVAFGVQAAEGER